MQTIILMIVMLNTAALKQWVIHRKLQLFVLIPCAPNPLHGATTSQPFISGFDSCLHAVYNSSAPLVALEQMVH